jgi:hypothetical protein
MAGVSRYPNRTHMRKTVCFVAVMAGLVASSHVEAATGDSERHWYCGPGAGVGGSNLNYFYAYGDLLCMRDSETSFHMYPGLIGGAEVGLVAPALAAGLVYSISSGGELVTFQEAVWLLRGKVLLPWGILGWERSFRYGPELALQILVFRVSVGVYWNRHSETPSLFGGLALGFL